MIRFLKDKLRASLIPGKRLNILTYHQVSKVYDPKFNHKNVWLSADVFEQQLQQLKKTSLVLSLPDAINKLQNNEINQPAFVLTFDDGDISVQHTIVPLLEKHRLPATFFINSAYLDSNKSYWFVIDYYIRNNEKLKFTITPEYQNAIDNIRRINDPEKYNEYREIIESYQTIIPDDVRFHVSNDFLKNLNPELFTVGLHGHEHQRYTMMPNTWKKENLEKNIAALKDLPAYFNAFAIPFGSPDDWDVPSVNIAKEMGLHFLLALKGFNLKYTDILLRDSYSDVNIKEFLNSQSPFYKKYLALNGVK